MSKGLEVYKAIAKLEMSAMNDKNMSVEKAEELRQIIEKPIKAFDIMLENNVELSILRRSRTCEEYNRQSYRRLSQEHFNFLKEQIR